eukprot:TRINITY_DN35779_c0_g1_i2.p2 TRINITY_DN35779_c0_g1~~TRINITY_DN35779_c0_g1_i2.p2  ORF type:complete len:277 (+),score=66.49 TRINITY_DN35779_c0_g1_i2:73-831(+)
MAAERLLRQAGALGVMGGGGKGVGALTLFVRAPDGDLRALEVPADATVGDVRAAAAEALQLPDGGVSRRVQLGDAVLDDAVSCADAGLCSESVVELTATHQWRLLGHCGRPQGGQAQPRDILDEDGLGFGAGSHVSSGWLFYADTPVCGVASWEFVARAKGYLYFVVAPVSADEDTAGPPGEKTLRDSSFATWAACHYGWDTKGRRFEGEGDTHAPPARGRQGRLTRCSRRVFLPSTDDEYRGRLTLDAVQV